METMSKQELKAMLGCTLVGPDGEKIGKITDVYLDERTQQPEWVAVSTGMLGLKESYVPLSAVHPTEGRGGEYGSRLTKDQVKDAPVSDADGALSPDQEAELYRHYGMEPPASTLPTSAAQPAPPAGGHNTGGVSPGL